MAIAFRAGANGSAALGVTSLAVTFTEQVNDTVIVVVGLIGGSLTASSVKDDATPINTFTKAINKNDGVNGTDIWYALNIPNAGTTITITTAAASLYSVSIGAYTGVIGTGNTGTNSASLSSNLTVTVTTQDSNNFVVMGGHDTINGGTFSATAPNVVRQQNAESTDQASVLADAGAFVTAGAHTITVTDSVTTTWQSTGLELRSVLPLEGEDFWDKLIVPIPLANYQYNLYRSITTIFS